MGAKVNASLYDTIRTIKTNAKLLTVWLYCCVKIKKNKFIVVLLSKFIQPKYTWNYLFKFTYIHNHLRSTDAFLVFVPFSE